MCVQTTDSIQWRFHVQHHAPLTSIILSFGIVSCWMRWTTFGFVYFGLCLILYMERISCCLFNVILLKECECVCSIQIPWTDIWDIMFVCVSKWMNEKWTLASTRKIDIWLHATIRTTYIWKIIWIRVNLAWKTIS